MGVADENHLHMLVAPLEEHVADGKRRREPDPVVGVQLHAGLEVVAEHDGQEGHLVLDAGQGIDAVRPIRDDIRARIAQLVSELV